MANYDEKAVLDLLDELVDERDPDFDGALVDHIAKEIADRPTWDGKLEVMWGAIGQQADEDLARTVCDCNGRCSVPDCRCGCHLDGYGPAGG